METIQKSRPLQAFLLALFAAVVMFLPLVIFDKGYFIYYGDFNVQQIPFYQLAHEAVRSGDVFWSWYTDLGANFIGSYSFYLLFSPFFWLTLPFPAAALPHLMAPLLALKTACAAATAALYLRRFVRDGRYAVLGGVLYAFSGWMDFNIFFNHFHEAAVFFPLLLLGVELLVQEDRRGPLLFAVAVNAAVNYWFFAGEAVFVILYVLLRRTDRSWGLTWKKFWFIALEAVLGAGLASVALLPSVLALMGNPRTALQELLSGWDVWLYWHEQRQPAILQSLFYPPELPAYPNFFPDHGAKWSSLSGWLPLVAMTGVLAYFFRRKNDWLKRMLTLCLIFALVPALNSLFILLNNSYYARWFYMPVLLMAMATVRALEDSEQDQAPFRRACFWSLAAILLFAVMSGLTPRWSEEGFVLFGLASDLRLLWMYVAIALTCLAATAALVLRQRENRRFFTMMLAGVLVVSVGFNVFYMFSGKNSREVSQRFIDHAIHGREQISLPEEPFARADVYRGEDNAAMFWRLPNIQAFHSVVPASIMEFYPEVGVTRDVGSRPEAELYALRPLLSVRWLFIPEEQEDQSPMPGYTFYDRQNGYNIYENENFLPMGFAYDSFVYAGELADVPETNRADFMLRAVVLDEESGDRNRDLLDWLTGEDFYDFNPERMAEDAAILRRHTADRFAIDNRGFTAATSFDRERFLFFSVPWERGWSARIRVDGGGWQPARIEKANIGFMAVRVPPGAATVRFDYFTPGLREGAIFSAGFLCIAAGYLFLTHRPSPRRRAGPQVQEALLSGESVTLTWDEYRQLYGDPEARAARLQDALNAAASIRQGEARSEKEKTLRFQPPTVRGIEDGEEDNTHM